MAVGAFLGGQARGSGIWPVVGVALAGTAVPGFGASFSRRRSVHVSAVGTMILVLGIAWVVASLDIASEWRSGAARNRAPVVMAACLTLSATLLLLRLAMTRAGSRVGRAIPFAVASLALLMLVVAIFDNRRGL